MSADNGIYVLEMKDQVRVIHTQNIENLWWSDLEKEQVADFVPTRIVEYYAGAKPMTLEEAGVEAKRLYDEILADDFCPICEYGICHFAIDKTWDEIVVEAKELAPKELEKLKSEGGSFWQYETDELQKIIDM